MKSCKRIFPWGLSFVFVLSLLLAFNSIRPIALSNNLGFESDLSGWSSGVTVGISTGEVVNTSGFVWTVNQDESKMARLQPTGPSGTFTSVADVLAMSQDSRDYIVSVFPGITNIAYLYTDMQLAAGESFSMAWNYVATDYVPYNDASFTTFVNLDDASKTGLINNLPTPVSILGATVPGTGNYSTGSYSSTGWQTTTYTAVSAGTYRLGFTVYNLDDTALSPILFVDKDTGTTLKNGVNFNPIPPDDNPPPPPVTSAPFLSTFNVSEITKNSALMKVTISSDGGEEISVCGFYLATQDNPTKDDTVIYGSCDVGENSFEFLSGTVNTTYYYRAFATNSVGTTLSNVGQFTTLKNTPTLTFQAIADKTYGDTSFSLVANTSSSASILYVSSDPEIASIEGNTVTIHKVGEVVISASVAENNEYYGLTANQPLKIVKKELIVSMNPSEKTYGDPDPQFRIDYDGFVYEDNASSLGGKLDFSREANENVGKYPVVAEGLTSDNYQISYVSGDLVIKLRPLTVNVQAASKIYGSNDPKFMVEFDGFAFDDSASVLSGTLQFTREANQNVGNYPIVAEGLTSDNYAISYVSADLDILPCPLTVNIHSASKIYGSEDPQFTFDYDGFAYDDTASNLSGTLKFSREANENVGNYPIVGEGLTSDNYEISYVSSDLYILPRSLTVKVQPSTKTYGNPDPQFSVDYDGFVYEDNAFSLSGSLDFSRDFNENVGKYPVVAEGLTSDNYTISYESADLVILPRQLVVSVQSAYKTYGTNDPKFTVSYRGFAFNDTTALVQGLKITRKAGQDVGNYPITASSASAENYVLSFENSQLSILKKELTITVNDQVKIYGDVDPAFTVSYNGFVFGEDAGVVSGLVVNRDSGEMVGDYVLSIAEAVSNNYQLNFVSGKLSIQKATLTLKVEDAKKVEGEQDPTFTYVVQGLKNNDTKDAVKNVTFKRETGEDIATYKISIKDAQSDNYTMTFIDGTLTIEKKESNGLAGAGLVLAGVGIPSFFFLFFFFKRKKKQDE